MHGLKWLYTVVGGSTVFGCVNYFQREKKCAETSWTTNFTPSVKWDSNWDKRDSSKPKKSAVLREKGDRNKENIEENEAKPTAVRYLLLIRHGHYNGNASKSIDKCLTTLGRSQAELTGIRLKQLNFNFTRLVHSTSIRAKETADIIHKFLPNVPMESCDMLCEGAPILPDPPISDYSDAEYYEDGARIEAAFRKYFYRADPSQKTDSYEILVCHGNVIRYFICRVLQFPPEGWFRFNLHHCSLTWVRLVPSGRVSVFTIGDCGHLPPEKITAA